MRKRFAHYYQPTEADFQSLWKEARFVFDANVLLNLYRYSKAAQDSLIEIMEAFKERIWLPHQAAHEFHANRLLVISEQQTSYDKMKASLDDVMKKFQSPNVHPFLTPEMLERFEAMVAQISAHLKDESEKIGKTYRQDTMLDRVSALFDGRVGTSLAPDALKRLIEAGNDRYAKKIPPGYEDDGKGDRRFGDLLVWRQTIDYAKAEKAPVIFVTDDAKEDWWWEHKGKTLGPRVELIEEFVAETQQRFWMYRPNAFIEHAGRELGKPVKQDVLDEVAALQYPWSSFEAEMDHWTTLITLLVRDEQLLAEKKSAREVALRDYETARNTPPHVGQPDWAYERSIRYAADGVQRAEAVQYAVEHSLRISRRSINVKFFERFGDTLASRDREMYLKLRDGQLNSDELKKVAKVVLGINL